MQLKLATLAQAAAGKGIVMEINNKKNHLSRIRVSFIMLLFAVCLTMNVFFYGAYYLYELSNMTTVIETRSISESITASDGGDNTTYSMASFLSKSNSYNETIPKKICSIHMNAVIPEEIIPRLFLAIVFLLFFMTLFILLPDGWSLINQKVRLDN